MAISNSHILSQHFLSTISVLPPSSLAMALSQPEAAPLTSRQPGPADNEERSLCFSAVRLQKLPHLTDYLPDLSSQPNPLNRNRFFHPVQGFYVSESDVVLRQIVYDLSGAFSSYSDSSHFAYHRAATRAAIVIWSSSIYGIKAGYRGFYSFDPIELNPRIVHGWHKRGGTVLGTSKGGFDVQNIVDAIEHHGYNQLLCSKLHLSLYCALLAHSSIHGAMAGYTGYIPLVDVAGAKNPVNTKDHKWAWVRSVTNQPDFLKV